MYLNYVQWVLDYQEFIEIAGFLLVVHSIPVYRGILDNRGIGTFCSIPVQRIYDNRGPNNQGPMQCMAYFEMSICAFRHNIFL